MYNVLGTYESDSHLATLLMYCMTCSPVDIDEVEECTDDDDIDDLDEDGEPIISEDDNSDDDDHCICLNLHSYLPCRHTSESRD